MNIAEIYIGIEGEGSRIGTPQTFIRTQGCSIGCKWCDTSYANEKYSEEEIQEEKIDKEGKIIQERKVLKKAGPGKSMTPEEILAFIQENNFNTENISITGGNPLEQEDLLKLVSVLRKNNYNVSIECSGQDYNEDVFRVIDFISCDIKTPSSGIKCDLDNIKKIAKKYDFKAHFKAVIADEKDLKFITEVYSELKKGKKNDINIILTPCWPEKSKNFNKALIEKIQKTVFNTNMDVRIILQQHKVIYGASEKGV